TDRVEEACGPRARHHDHLVFSVGDEVAQLVHPLRLRALAAAALDQHDLVSARGERGLEGAQSRVVEEVVALRLQAEERDLERAGSVALSLHDLRIVADARAPNKRTAPARPIPG